MSFLKFFSDRCCRKKSGPLSPTTHEFRDYIPQKFSILMPCYNDESTIAHSIESVLDQTYQNFELIILDDGSTDNSKNIINAFKQIDMRILTDSHPSNKGASFARNTSYTISSGQYLAFIDADDTWPKHKLQRYHDQFIKGHDLIFSSYLRVAQNKTLTMKLPNQIDYNQLLKSNFIALSTGSYDLSRIPFVPFEPIGHEDYLMWLTLFPTVKNPCALEEPLMCYHMNKNSLSANKFKAAKWTWDIYSKHLRLGLIRSLYYFFHYARLNILKNFL
jgi:teichuronic acid biosynthesis glycosyltransferase TuaG